MDEPGLSWSLESIERALHAGGAALEDVGVDHGGADVGMAEEFLDGADIVAGFEEVGGEAVTEGMAAYFFREMGVDDGSLDSFLE
jgi:hypothetical protein